jgi:hypothetical protein
MWLLSYFWDSEIHLEALGAGFESVAAFLELFIALWIFKTLKQLQNHPTEEEEHTKEWLEAFFTLIAAALVIVPILCAWRLIVLHERSDIKSEEILNLQSNKLVQAQAKVFELESKSRWREMTQKQKDNLIKSTRNIQKFGIRVRYGTHDAEVQSFAKMVRETLDAAGFTETNVPPLQAWPPNINILFPGGEEEMPSLFFLNNIQITNATVGQNNEIPDKVFYVMSDGNAIDADEFRSIISGTNSFSVVLGDGGVAVVLQKTNYALAVPAHSTRTIFAVSDPNVIKIWDFMKLQAIFYSAGITTGWVTDTNLAPGTCEIFINPKL